MNFVFNQAALIEYPEAAEWYQSRSILAGPRFIQEVETAIQAILKDPRRYQTVGNGCAMGACHGAAAGDWLSITCTSTGSAR